MRNITLITSVIDTPNLPLSYTQTRSVFNKQQRLEQTKQTILSIREKIPNTRIILIECSSLTDEERRFFVSTVDFFINIFDTKNELLIQRMFTISKAMGEGTMTILALQFLINNNVEFDNLFKISGRYWLNHGFDYLLYHHSLSCVHKINNDNTNMLTCFYKLSKELTVEWLQYLIDSEADFVHCVGYEVIFAKFLKNKTVKLIENKVGINGYIAVCGTLIDM